MKNLIYWLKKGTECVREGSEKGSGFARFDSHSILSRQSVFAILCMLFLGTGQVWGDITFSGGYVYFDNTNTDWSSSEVIELVAHQYDKKDYIGATTMSKISGTNNLYYCANPQGSGWGYIWGWRFMHNGSAWGNSDNSDGSVQSYSGGYTATTDYGLNSGGYYLSYGASSADGCALTTSYLGNSNSYSQLNYTQTLYQCVAENGGTPAKSTASIATIGITTKKLNGNSSTTDDNGNISSGQNYVAKSAARTATVTMEATSIADGYTFLGWYDAETSGTRLEASTTYEYEASAAKTVYARFSHETTHSVDITYKCGATTVSTATSQAIGQVTASSITAPTVAGYTFTSWTLGTGMSNQSENTSANPISVKTLSSGTYTMQANYTEDLTSPWTLKGGTNLTGDNWATEHALTKKTGHSTESVAYYTFSISSTNSGISGSADAWSFKLINSDYYGLTADGSYWWQRSTSANQSLSTSGANIQVCADVTGDYEVKVDYSTPASPKVTVTFPTSYTLTYAIGDVKGNDGSISSSPSTSSGSYVASGSTVTLTAPNAATGYTWKGWYGAANGSGDQLCSTKAYAITVSANTTVYACYTENSYSTTVQVSPAGYGTTTPSAGTQYIKHHTGNSISAATSNATYYVFKEWSVTDGGLTMSSSASTTPNTFKATAESGTITANFSAKWHIVGGDGDDPDSDDEMGDWNKWANGILNFGTVNSTQDTGYVNINLPANTTFKFKVADLSGSEAWYGNTGTMTYADNNKQEWDMSTEVSYNCGITTAGKGTYKFSWNMYTKKVRVAYPVSHIVNFSVGTVPGADGTPTAATAGGNAFTNGQYVTNDTTVTFTAPEAKDGYTWEGWYTTPTTSGTKLSTDDELTYTTTISAAKTVYAVYTENMHTVTLTAGAHGTAHVTGGVATSGDAGIATGLNITATPDDGFFFSEWELVSGTAIIANTKSASTSVTATADATVRAKFVGEWVLAGIGDWDPTAHGFGDKEEVDEKELCYMNMDLEANTDYTFKVVKLVLDGDNVWYGNNTSTQYMNYASNNGQYWQFETGGDKANCGLTTAGKGTYQFVWNITDKQLKIIFPESNTITYSVYKFLGDDESNSESTAAGSITSVKDPENNDLTSGKYVIDNGVVTFTHSDPATNYHFAGWYSDAACETAYENGKGGAVINNEEKTLALTVSADAAVYAKFAENMTTVEFSHNSHGHIEFGGRTVTSITAGTVTTRSITAVPDAGWYFAGWELSADPDFAISGGTGESNTNPTLSGLGTGATSGQTLTANFVECEKIYFRNIFDDGAGNVSRWSAVYAYFDYTWDGTKVKTANNDTYRVAMSRIGSSDVYWGYVPRAFTNSGSKKVAFADTEFAKNFTFYNVTASGSKGSARGDYSRSLNMFVPNHTNNKTNDNGVDYFDSGYWMKYDTRASQGVGYYLKKYKSRNNYWQMGEFIATSDEATAISFTIRVDNTSADSTRFMIVSAGGLNYIAESAISSTDYTKNVYENLDNLKDKDIYFQLNLDNEGDYTFILDQSGDVMKLTVDYPVSPGDYRLIYTYDSGSKTHASDIIKPNNVSSTSVKKSMYINPAKSAGVYVNNLKLQKCTGLNESTKEPEWTSGVEISLDNFTEEKGVYEFDMSITDGRGNSNEVASVALSDVKIYDGPFYIKTDYAPGHWVNYKENILNLNSINFDKDNEQTFDYYHCAWIGDGDKNVKCIIANDYNEQITDTLIGDDILGKLEDGTTPRQALATGANVRFSYNSYTNELKRAYINGSSDWQKTFLRISAASDVIKGKYGNTWVSHDTTFVDINNWTYMLDLQAQEGALVKLTANYRFNSTDHEQYLIGSAGDYDAEHTKEIIGGSGSTWSTLRIIYDFKTNHLLSAWLATGDQISGTDKVLNTDLMILREGQEDAKQITFASGIKMSNVDTVYAVMKLEKDFILGARPATERLLYWISFPFDVKLSDVFGMGTYGTHWIIEYYDGKERAQKGYWADSPGFWKYVMPDERETFIMKKNVGYVLALDETELYYTDADHHSAVWDNNATSAYIYFPSSTSVGNIQNVEYVDVTIDQDGYECTIGPRFENGDNRTIKDSYWHLIGVPSYANTTYNSLGEAAPESWSPGSTLYFYDWNPATNTYSIEASSSYNFKPMHSYMVQYGSTTLRWSNNITNTVVPAGVAARVAETTDYNLKLSLLREDEEQDRTLLRMTNDVNATNRFEFNYDICKEYNGGRANIWTVTDDTVEVAGNCLPTSTQTTIIPVGVKVVANGDYTFSIPDGTSGMNVTLVDTYTGARTSLGLIDYTTYLTTGTHDGRFLLEIAPVQNVVTEIENAANANANANADVRKVLIDGRLYIVKDGKAYDATGQMVK